MNKILKLRFLLFTLVFILSACAFQLQGAVKLAPPFHRMYLQTSDPYGQLSRSLQAYFKMSNIELAKSTESADTILVILQDSKSEQLLSVSSTQQTRQYNLKVAVLFQITDKNGHIIVPPQSLSETRTITIQSNQILGNSNEANLYYQQIRRSLAYAIMNRLASQEISTIALNAFPDEKH